MVDLRTKTRKLTPITTVDRYTQPAGQPASTPRTTRRRWAHAVRVRPGTKLQPRRRFSLHSLPSGGYSLRALRLRHRLSPVVSKGGSQACGGAGWSGQRRGCSYLRSRGGAAAPRPASGEGGGGRSQLGGASREPARRPLQASSAGLGPQGADARLCSGPGESQVHIPDPGAAPRGGDLAGPWGPGSRVSLGGHGLAAQRAPTPARTSARRGPPRCRLRVGVRPAQPVAGSASPSAFWAFTAPFQLCCLQVSSQVGRMDLCSDDRLSGRRTCPLPFMASSALALLAVLF